KYYNYPLNNLPSLTYLSFEIDAMFDHSLNNLPKSILKLNGLNKSIDIKSYFITKLTLSNSFDEPVDNFPQTLKILTFGSSFNQSVDNLPSSLQKLTLGDSFNRSVNKLP